MGVAEQNNNEVMIQLPWTVPQQPLVQTASVVENPSRKMELDLNHSTDTTAIWSFLAAMVASMVVAIWYGRKSFKLTEMSFDAVITQIKASEQSALDLNIRLFEQQKILQENELSFRELTEWKKEIRVTGAEIYKKITQIVLIVHQILENDLDTDPRLRLDVNSEVGRKIEKIHLLFESVLLDFGNLELLFAHDSQDGEKVDGIIYILCTMLNEGIQKIKFADSIENILFNISIVMDVDETTYSKKFMNDKLFTRLKNEDQKVIIFSALLTVVKELNYEIKRLVNK